ncbi:MAG: hypothetical protein M3008_04070 [Chloroflexota bacterium]|nr:hypothetical protein [Chloroflexota bacterium]
MSSRGDSIVRQVAILAQVARQVIGQRLRRFRDPGNVVLDGGGIQPPPEIILGAESELPFPDARPE